MSSLRRALFALAISMAVPACAVQAATFNVPNGDVAALKNAINLANTNGQIDTINLAANGNYAIVSVDNTPPRPDLNINADGENGLPIIKADGGRLLTINGNGATLVRQTPYTTAGYRFFTVAAGARVTLDKVTLQKGYFPNGQSTVGGAAILNKGTATLRGCTVTGGQSSPAGAIFNLGALTIENSSFAQNGTNSNAGAIFSQGAAATLTVTGSSFAGNSGGEGGALYIRDSSATIRNTTFSGNSAIGSGGAISVGGASSVLSVQDSSFDSNRASVQSGGGIIVRDATAKVERCTFTKNFGYNGGGLSSSGQLTLLNSTFSANIAQGNTAQGSSGGFNGGGLEITPSSVTSPNTTVDSCTFTGNKSDNPRAFTVGGIAAGSSPLTIRNTIVVGNGENNARDIEGRLITSGGNNLIGETISQVFVASDQVGVTDAKLGPLAGNGGATQTHALLAGSPAINKGNTALATDQRGIARPQGGIDDIGAFELQAATPPPPPSETPSLIVTTTDDVAANDGKTSLREAINYANTKAGADTVSFANNVRGKITLLSRLPKITGNLTINGPGAPLLAIDGSGKVKLFHIGAGVSADINYLTLSGARYNASEGPEGAVLNQGNLILRQLAMTGNIGIEGGAVTNVNGSVQVVGCQISGNIALNGGGGLLNNNGALLVLNSTISNNAAVGNVAGASGGGGVSSFGANARTTLEYVTMTGNRAPNVAANTRAGVWIESGVFVPHNSIFFGNGARDLQIDGGNVRSSGYNIIGKTSGTTGLTSTDRLGIDPKLGALADNGGSTKTQALWPGSPAINSGNPNISNGSDQRGLGFPRLRGGRIDVGAFEVQSDLATSAQTAKSYSAPNAVSTNKAPSGGSS